MEENRITVGFAFTDECKNEFSQSSNIEVFHSLGENELDVIGRQLNSFLRQCGYERENDELFMEDISEDECSFLSDCLNDYRSKIGCGKSD